MKQTIKNDQYRTLIRTLEIDYGASDVAGWFALGDTSTASIVSVRSAMNKKLLEEGKPLHRRASSVDVLASELLAFLDAEGYDLNRIVRNEEGRLLDILKRPIPSERRVTRDVFAPLHIAAGYEPGKSD